MGSPQTDWFSKNSPQQSQPQQGGDWFAQNSPKFDNSQPTQFERDRLSDVGLVPVQRAIAKAAGKPSPNLSNLEPTAEGRLVPAGSTYKAVPFAAANNVLYPGTGTAAQGVKDIAQGNVARGAHGILSGGLEALSTGTPAALEAAPLSLARGLAGGVAGSEAGSRGVKALGAGPDIQNLAGDVGGALGATAGVSAGNIEKLNFLKSLPSTEKAGLKFQDISKVAGQNTVHVTPELSDALLHYQELVDAGGSRSLAVNKLVNRLTNPEKGPLTYDEARLFQSNISRLSADETQRLTPVMKRQVGDIASKLNGAVENTAASAGKLDDFRSAMREYSQAKTNEARAAVLKKWAIKAGAAAGLGAAGVSGVKLLQELQ